MRKWRHLGEGFLNSLLKIRQGQMLTIKIIIDNHDIVLSEVKLSKKYYDKNKERFHRLNFNTLSYIIILTYVVKTARCKLTIGSVGEE